MLTMLPGALKTKWEHEVRGTHTDVQSQFTFANTWSLIGSHSGDANLVFGLSIQTVLTVRPTIWTSPQKTNSIAKNKTGFESWKRTSRLN